MVAIELPGPRLYEEKRVKDEIVSGSQILVENGNGGHSRRIRNREAPSRYMAATISSAAASVTSHRSYPSPILGRSPSPNRGKSSHSAEISAPKKDNSPERRPSSAERRRLPWPSANSDAKLLNGKLDAVRSLSMRLPGREASDGVLPSNKNNLSSFPQSETFSVSSPNVLAIGKVKQPSITCLSSLMQSETSDIVVRIVNGRLQQDDAQLSENALKPSVNGVHRSSSDEISAVRHLKLLERTGGPERKGTPDMRRSSSVRQSPDQVENARHFENPKPKSDQQRWFGRSTGRGAPRRLNRSMDLSSEKESSNVESSIRSQFASSKSAKSTMPTPSSRRSIHHHAKEELDIQLNSLDDLRMPVEVEDAANAVSADFFDTISDASIESIGGFEIASAGSRRGTTVPARFWHYMTARLGRVSANEQTNSVVEGEKPVRRTKAGLSSNSYPSSTAPPGRASVSSSQQPVLPSAHGKASQTPLPPKGLASPPKTKVLQLPVPQYLSLNGRPSNAGSFLNLGVDARKGRKGLSQQEDAQDLRLFHNRYLQWRFANAKTDAAMIAQQVAVENMLYGVWTRTVELRTSVAKMQAEIQRKKQSLKLDSILSSYTTILNSWESLQQEHISSLTGVTKALEVETIRVPVTGVAKVDMRTLKEALGSAIDVMSGVEFLVKRLIPKAAWADSLVSELAKVVVKEKALLEESRELLAAAASLETEECSLLTDLIQRRHERSCKAIVSLNN